MSTDRTNRRAKAGSEKDRLVRELREGEQKYREIFNATNEAIAVEDTETGAFVDVNEPMVRMYGYASRKELLAASIGDLSECDPPHTQEEAVRLNDLAAAGSPQVFEWIAKRKNGELFNVEVSLTCSPIRGKNRVLAVVRDITERKRAEAAIHEAHGKLEAKVRERTAELRALAAELVRAEDRERERIVRILHEDVQQMIVGARFMLGGLRRRHASEEARAIADEVGHSLERANECMRSLCVELRPPVLYAEGLGAALAWLAKEMKRKYGLTMTVRAEAAAEPTDEEHRSFVYQTLRELLLNAVKHAGVKRVQVSLRVRDGSRIQLEVKDRGKGFEPTAVGAGGFGLFRLRERAEYLGGELNVCSSPGKGTCVTLTLPRP